MRRHGRNIIAPELVELGDEIEVTFPSQKGITVVKRGVVAEREDHGATRRMRTSEGGWLFTWDAKGFAGTVELLKREVKQTPLEMFDETRERIAS